MGEGWMACEESKFPGGHGAIVDAIRSHGFQPAIWTNANITNEEFPKFHPENLIFHEGKPLKGEWIDYLYNCMEETLEKHVRPVFQGFAKAGYQYSVLIWKPPGKGLGRIFIIWPAGGRCMK